MNKETKGGSSSTIVILLSICILEIISHWMSGSEKLYSDNVFFRLEVVRTLIPVLFFVIASLIYYSFISDPKGFKKNLLLAILAIAIVIELPQIFYSGQLGGAGQFFNKVSSYIDLLAQLLRIYVIYKVFQISER
jgi:hypothetical protein